MINTDKEFLNSTYEILNSKKTVEFRIFLFQTLLLDVVIL
jgi:hypothetical protein